MHGRFFFILILLLRSPKQRHDETTDTDSRTDLQLKADEHNQEDKTETEDADGQADQPPEQTPPPRRIVELLTSRYRTAALDSLQTEAENMKEH